jgi:hypothetical protein
MQLAPGQWWVGGAGGHVPNHTATCNPPVVSTQGRLAHGVGGWVGWGMGGGGACWRGCMPHARTHATTNQPFGTNRLSHQQHGRADPYPPTPPYPHTLLPPYSSTPIPRHPTPQPPNRPSTPKTARPATQPPNRPQHGRADGARLAARRCNLQVRAPPQVPGQRWQGVTPPAHQMHIHLNFN